MLRGGGIPLLENPPTPLGSQGVWDVSSLLFPPSWGGPSDHLTLPPLGDKPPGVRLPPLKLCPKTDDLTDDIFPNNVLKLWQKAAKKKTKTHTFGYATPEKEKCDPTAPVRADRGSSASELVQKQTNDMSSIQVASTGIACACLFAKQL